MYCTKCGKENDENLNVCLDCYKKKDFDVLRADVKRNVLKNAKSKTFIAFLSIFSFIFFVVFFPIAVTKDFDAGTKVLGIGVLDLPIAVIILVLGICFKKYFKKTFNNMLVEELARERQILAVIENKRDVNLEKIKRIESERHYESLSDEDLVTSLLPSIYSCQYFNPLLISEKYGCSQESATKFLQILFLKGKIKPAAGGYYQLANSLEAEMEKIDSMAGLEFEQYTAKLLTVSGFPYVQVTPASNDYGVDIVALDSNGIRYAIQCKCYSSNLGNSPVQEVKAGMIQYNCQVGVVLTNSYFTENAKQLAKSNSILLWNRDKLTEMVEAYLTAVRDYHKPTIENESTTS